MAVLNIKDNEAHAMATELARRTGQTLTGAVKDALRDKLQRERNRGSDSSRLVARVMEIAHRAASRPVLDPRSPDEIIGYDEYGVPR
ncbi:MAG: type II toxin-antitoxin system VapB family antitoxin [Bryobacteraceae bacterium]